MRLLSSALLLTTLAMSPAAFAAQSQTPATSSTPAMPPTAASATTPASAPKPPSALMQPALGTLQQALDAVRLDKWKTSNTLRQEADANINSIRHDLDTTLPPLLATADAAPDSITHVLPAYRNIEALYDVVLRVSAVARLSAPSQQSAALEQAMLSLDDARRALGDHLQLSANTQEKKIVDLQTALRAIPAAPAPASVVATPPPPEKKRKPRTRTKKPTPAPASSQSTAPVPPKS